MNGKYKAAIRAYRRVVALDPDDHGSWYQAAILLLLDGDRAGHRRWCVAMLKRFGNTKDVQLMERTAKACLLSPEPPGELALLTRLVDRAVKEGAKNVYFADIQAAKGLAELRAGRFARAADWLHHSIDGQRALLGKAVTYCLLALAEGKNGNRAAARKVLNQAKEIYRRPATINQVDHLIYELVRREAKELLAEKK